MTTRAYRRRRREDELRRLAVKVREREDEVMHGSETENPPGIVSLADRYSKSELRRLAVQTAALVECSECRRLLTVQGGVLGTHFSQVDQWDSISHVCPGSGAKVEAPQAGA